MPVRLDVIYANFRCTFDFIWWFICVLQYLLCLGFSMFLSKIFWSKLWFIYWHQLLNHVNRNYFLLYLSFELPFLCRKISAKNNNNSAIHHVSYLLDLLLAVSRRHWTQQKLNPCECYLRHGCIHDIHRNERPKQVLPQYLTKACVQIYMIMTEW